MTLVQGVRAAQRLSSSLSTCPALACLSCCRTPVLSLPHPSEIPSVVFLGDSALPSFIPHPGAPRTVQSAPFPEGFPGAMLPSCHTAHWRLLCTSLQVLSDSERTVLVASVPYSRSPLFRLISSPRAGLSTAWGHRRLLSLHRRGSAPGSPPSTWTACCPSPLGLCMRFFHDLDHLCLPGHLLLIRDRSLSSEPFCRASSGGVTGIPHHTRAVTSHTWYTW